MDVYCGVWRDFNEFGNYYVFNVSFVLPVSDGWQVIISLGPYNNDAWLRGTCDSMLNEPAGNWSERWLSGQIVANDWVYGQGDIALRHHMYVERTLEQLTGCLGPDSMRILPTGVCDVADTSGSCDGRWYATAVRAVDVDDESLGEETLFSVPCGFNLRQKFCGSVSSMLRYTPFSVNIVWVKAYCVADTRKTSFTVRSCVGPYSIAERIRLDNPTIEIQPGRPAVTIATFSPNCTVLDGKCCQEMQLIVDTLPPVNESVSVQWGAIINELPVPGLVVSSHINIDAASACGEDIYMNFSCQAYQAVSEDSDFSELYDLSTSDPIAAGSRVYTLLQLDTECCASEMRMLLVTAIRLCWSTTGVELVPYDANSPTDTGCNTPGADADSVLIYTDTGVDDAYYLPIVADTYDCQAVVSWLARVEVRVTRLVQAQIEWKAVKGVLIPTDEPDGVSARAGTYIHFNNLPYVVGCPAGQILTASLECVSVRPWTYVDTIILISVVSGVIILILVVRSCVRPKTATVKRTRRRPSPPARSVFITNDSY
jgi:hypothetical protein